MRALLICLTAVLLTGCAVTRQYTPAQSDKPRTEMADVFIMRPSPIAFAVKTGVYQDGDLVGDLGAKNYLRWQVPANGESIELMSRMENRSKLTFTPEAGKIYYFKVGLRPGWAFTRNKLQLLEEEKALKLLSRLSR